MSAILSSQPHPNILCRQKVAAHRDGVSTLDFHIRPQILCSAANFVLEPADTTIRVWDTEKGHLILEIKDAHVLYIKQLSFSPLSETLLASSGEDNVLKIWEWPKKNLLNSLDCGSSCVRHCWHPQVPEVIAAASESNIIRVWKYTDQGKPISEMKTDDKINALVFHPKKENLLFSGGQGMIIRIWDWREEQLQKKIETSDWVIDLAFDPRRPDTVAAAYFGQRIFFWNIETSKPIGVLREHTDEINKIIFHPKTDHLLASDKSGLIRVWDVEYNISLEKIARRMYEGMEAKDRTYLLKTYKNCLVASDIVQWLKKNAATVMDDSEAVQLGLELQKHGYIEHASEKSKKFDNKNLFFVFKKIPSPKETNYVLAGHQASVLALTVSSEGVVASGSVDQHIRLWHE